MPRSQRPGSGPTAAWPDHSILGDEIDRLDINATLRVG
jgi:hypothetical protein